MGGSLDDAGADGAAPPPGTALARGEASLALPPRLSISSSLASSRPGELLMLDASGQVMDPARRRGLQLRGLLLVGALSGLLSAYGFVLFQALGAVAAPLMFLLVLRFRWRHARHFRDLAALVAERRDQEAWEAMDRLERRAMPMGQRQSLMQLRGHVAWRLGRRELALEWFTRGAQFGSGRRGRWASATVHLCQFQRAQLLAILGRLDEARALAAELSRAPAGDFFELQRAYVELTIAFCAGSAERVEGDLYGWARTVLGANRFGSAAALLAWAFAERGDEEMAAHMLAEAGPRMTGERLVMTNPALDGWFRSACAARGIAPTVERGPRSEAGTGGEGEAEA